MKSFLMALVLAGLYMLLTGATDVAGFFTGLLIAWAVLSLVSLGLGRRDFPLKVFKIAGFGLYFVKILVQATLQVAREIITPGFTMTPRIVKYPVGGLTDVQITTLANAITLTPGTLTADVDEDGENLYIHCMYAADRAQAVAALDELKDKLLRGVF